MNIEAQKLLVVARIRPTKTIDYSGEQVSAAPTKGTKNSKSQLQQSQSAISKSVKTVKTLLKTTSSAASLASVSSSKTGASNNKSTIANQSSSKAKDAEKINLYACQSNEQNGFARIAVLNEIPISRELISKYFRTDENIFHDKDGLLPKSELFALDACFSAETT